MNKPTRNRDSVMKVVSKLKKNLYLFWYEFWGSRRLSKVRRKHSFVIFLRSYIQANLLFPDATLDENLKLSIFVCHGFLGILPVTKIKEVNDERVKRLRENLFSNERMMDALSKHFLLASLYYDFGNEYGHNKILKEKAKEAFTIAKDYKDTVKPIFIQDVKNMDKKIKKEIKMLKKNWEKIHSSKNKNKNKKSKVTDPIIVKATNVFIFASLVSSSFLVGGFFHAKFLLGLFDINTSDFFDISDYLSSSVDVIFPVFLFVVIGIFFYFEGASRSLSNVTIKKNLTVKIKSGIFLLWVIAIILGIIFFINLIYYEIFSSYFLFPSIFLLWDYMMFRLIKIDKYIENGFTFYSAVLSIFIFIVLLVIDISETYHEVETGSYQNSYIVSFQEEYKEYSEHEFFLANSNYVFLLDKEAKEIAVIPKTGIKALRAKKDDESFFFHLNVAHQRLQELLQILSDLQQKIAKIFTLESILNLFVSKHNERIPILHKTP